MTNGKISLRQMKRLLFFDVIGIGLVAMPDLLSAYAKTAGVFALFGGALLFMLYLWLLEKAMGGKGMSAKWVYGIYGIYLLLAGGYGLFLLADLVKKFLLPDQSYLLVVLLLLLLILYGKMGGLEGRARAYEVLFWPMVILLCILIGLGVRGVELENLLPIETSLKGFGKGVYLSFALCSVAQIMIFLPAYGEEGLELRELRKGLSGTVLWATLFLAVIYEILLGSFGQNALANARTPIMIYTSNIVVPGGFLRRQEALIAGVCFVALLAFAGSGFSYGTLCLKTVKEKKWVTVISALLLVCVAMLEHYSKERTYGVGAFLLYSTVIALFLPFLLAGEKNRKKMVALGVAICFATISCGCSVKELENRSFPMIMSLQDQGGDCVLTYKYMDLSKVSEKDKTKGENHDIHPKASTVSAAIYQMDEMSGKVLDLNHVKVLLLERSFLENRKFVKELVEKGNSGVELPGNMLIFAAEDNQEILALQEEMEDDLGSYLEELMEGNPNYKSSGGTTFKNLICDYYNGNGNTVLPVLHSENGVPIMDGSLVLQWKDQKGQYQVNIVKEEDGLVANLCDGAANALDITIDEGRIHLENVDVDYEFSSSNRYLLCQVLVTGDIVKSESSSVDEKKLKIKAGDFFQGEITNKWKQEGIDLTNSYYHLKVHDRDLCQEYEGEYDKYCEDLLLQVKTDFRFVE